MENMIKTVVKAMENRKAVNVRVLHIEKLTTVADYFIIWYFYVHEFKVKVYSVPFSCITMF